MTAAQKAAKEKFSKAIAYRTKTGVSLKEAFAHVYGKKVGAVKKKAAPKKKAVVKSKYVKILGQEVKEGTKMYEKLVAQKKYFDDLKKSEIGAIKKKAAPKKKATPKKKAAVKKVTGSHKDTKSHNVNIRVVSGMYNTIDLLNDINYWQTILLELRSEYKSADAKYKKNIMQDISIAKKWLETRKKQLKSELDKQK